MNSSSSDSVRTWLFRGITTEDVLDRLESDGIAIRPSEDPRAVQRVMPLEDFSADIRRLAMASLGTYLAFFCIENSVRELVVQRLLENHGPDWWGKKSPAAVHDKVARRQQSEGQNRWHISRGAGEIYYTDFGDLKLIIQANWVDFSDLFPDQNWVISRLNELEASRNVIAHMNALDEREEGRIRLYLQDWVRQVG